MTAIFKVDASNHDWGRGPMDVAAMRRDGIDVFIHKATDGPHFYRDPYFGAAMSRARVAAMPITGAYHVLWNGNVTAQVDWFIDTVLAAAPWAATEPYEWMWDCEPFGYNGATPTVATINAACERFMQRLPNHRPLAYCPKWAYGSLAGLRCPVVASSYGTNPAVPYRQAYPGDGSGRWATYGGVAGPVILQFGSNTIVGGQRTVDANAFRGTLDQLRALIMTGEDDDQMKTMLVMVRGGDGRVWLSNGVTRYHVGDHTSTDKAVGGETVLRDVRYVSGAHQLGSLISDVVALVDDIDAFGAEIPADLTARLDLASRPTAQVAMTDADRQAIIAGVVAQMPKSPTAAEVAEELARRISNG